MGKKIFPRKPFKFGRFIVEYKEEVNSPLHFLKEEINTEAEAEVAAKRLEGLGYSKVVIKQVG
ncbi:hypothetical protein N9273_00395 [bacterium]|nr:hypothetical protein [bacterium]